MSTLFLNNVTKFELADEIGGSGFLELARLQGHLEDAGPTNLKLRQKRRERTTFRFTSARYAPSIIARSESEMLGLALPRFAIRVYLDEERKSFVNVRRLATLADQAQEWGAREILPGGVRLDHIEESKPGTISLQGIHRRPADLLCQGCCVADGVLAVPGHFSRDEWFVLTSALHKEYGEKDGKQLGTPYLKHIKLGGGMCAQAVAFMANALCIQHTGGAHGIAEITYLAQKPNGGQLPFGELRIDGLNMASLEAYFSNAGLSGIPQKSNKHTPGAKKSLENFPDPGASRVETEKAILSYVQSGFPVIVALDLGRLKGEVSKDAQPLVYPSIFESNQRIADARPKKLKHRSHAVVIVGVNSRTKEFLLHDPATYPYLKANIHQLFDAGCYCLDKKSQKIRVRGGQLIGVAPGRVRLPLLRSDPAGGTFGLFDFLGPIQTFPSFSFQSPLLDPELESDFFLRQVGANEPPSWKSLKEQMPSLLSGLERLKVSTRVTDSHWCWIQITAEAIWLWDAEMPPPRDVTEAASRSLLLGVFDKASGHELHISEDPHFSAGEPGKPGLFSGNGSSPTRAIVTSFSIGRSRTAMNQARPWFSHVELYTFMQPDAEAIFPQTDQVRRALRERYRSYTQTIKRYNRMRFFRLRDYIQAVSWSRMGRHLGRRLPWRMPVASAIDLMSEHAHDPKIHASVADTILESARLEGARITGFATFIPEIVSERPLARGKAVASLQFLVEVATLLKRSHPLSFIELVAGTRVWSLWQGIDQKAGTDEDRVANVVTIRDDASGLRAFLHNLQSCAEAARAAGIRFLIELEPGPLHILNNRDTLIELARLLEIEGEFKSLEDVVGLNLDIAHWHLAGIDPNSIPENVRRLVYNAHISDHGIGHFGDAVLGNIGRIDFRSWLAFLGTTEAKFVSLEQEVCEDTDCLALCDKTLKNLGI